MSKNIFEFFYKKRINLTKELTILRDSLEKLGDVPYGSDVFDYAVDFMNITTGFQTKMCLTGDLRGVNDFSKQLQNVLKITNDEAEALANLLRKSGYVEYGWIHGKKGDKVTLDNLYFGDRFGIWSKTARRFKELCLEGDDDIIKCIANYQVHDTIEFWRKEFIRLLNNILAQNKNNIVIKAVKRGMKDKKR